MHLSCQSTGAVHTPDTAMLFKAMHISDLNVLSQFVYGEEI